MEDQLIDSETEEAPKDVILDIIRWWERKRILFNVLQVGIVLFVLFFFYNGSSISAILRSEFIFQSLLYFLFVNFCYSAGWGVHLLLYYYFKTKDTSHILDIVLLILGSLFTSLVTFQGYYMFFRWSHRWG
ncbi:MAG: hypothetical protein HWE22_12565 [Flavobacteriales bacterium]|nr:hypothetical protein [Flavobacteriales bacterium]